MTRSPIAAGIVSGSARENYVQDSSLIFHLDANDPRSFPETGTTWFDISGRGNNFTIANASAVKYNYTIGVPGGIASLPTITAIKLSTSPIGYAVCNSNIDQRTRGWYTAEVEYSIDYRPVSSNGILFENTSNSPITGGIGFGFVADGLGSGYPMVASSTIISANLNNTPSSFADNYGDSGVSGGGGLIRMDTLEWNTQTGEYNLYCPSAIFSANSSGYRLLSSEAIGGTYLAGSGTTSISANINTNACYLGSRMVTSIFSGAVLFGARMYGRRLSTNERTQNMRAFRTKTLNQRTSSRVGFGGGGGGVF